MVKYHISKKTNRPNICKAEIRDCPLGIDIPHFSTREEAITHIEKENEASMTMFSTAQKSITTSLPQAMLHEEYFAKYTKNSFGKDSPEYAAIASEVAKITPMTNFTKAAFLNFDENWQTDGSSFVERVKLEDNQTGYYKSIPLNTEAGNDVSTYNATFLKASINEVRAYRLAETLGFHDLVPETSLRELPDGDFGSIQKEVISHTKKLAVVSPSEIKKAGIFDFIAGSQDRHDDNVIISRDGDTYKINLIDNGYSFPNESSDFHYNQSIFVGVHESDYFDYPVVKLTDNDVKSLKEKVNSEEFKDLATQFTPKEFANIKERIDFLISHRVVPSWENYFEAKADPNYNIIEELGLN